MKHTTATLAKRSGIKRDALPGLIAKLKAAEAQARAEVERLDNMPDDEFDEPAETARLREDLKRDRRLARTVGGAFGLVTRVPKKPQTPRRTPEERRPAPRKTTTRACATRGDPDDDSELSPPARACACGCGANLDALGKNRDARYASKTCAKRGQRRRDREQPDRVVERSAAPTGGRVRCRCGSQAAYVIDHRWICFPCGRPIVGTYSDVNGHLADREVLEVLRDEIRDKTTHVPWVQREWKTRPTRSESADLRRRDRAAGYKFPKRKKKAA